MTSFRNHAWTRKLASSPVASLAALPTRVRSVSAYDGHVLYESLRWLVRSREHTNFTYPLTARNLEHLCWFVCQCVDADIDDARGWMREIELDAELRSHVITCAAAAPRAGLVDRTAFFGRRAGWYCIVRALRPSHVVESGVDKGLGTCVLAAALLKNAEEGYPGLVTGLDINPAAGYMISGRYSEVAELRLGDSLDLIPKLDRPVDIFLHDSNHSPEHEAAEFRSVTAKLSDRGIVMSDNVMQSDELARYAESTGRRAVFFREEPDRHWWPGEGIGVALPR
jgi:Methyltransferase domain